MGSTEGRRGYPRVVAGIPVEIQMPDGHVITARARNISCGGLQLGLEDDAGGGSLVPMAGPEGGDTLEVAVRLHLPYARRPPKGIEARAQVVYSTRSTQGHVLIGLSCTRFEGEGYEDLERYSDERAFHDPGPGNPASVH